MIFVDTSAWFAAWVSTDPNHAVAEVFASTTNDQFITTDYVLDELLTLLRIRGETRRAVRAANQLLSDALGQIEWVSPHDVFEAAQIFRDYRDKRWSFTDCISLVVMRRLGIDQAFAFDDHFRQFGSITILPQSQSILPQSQSS